MGLKRHKSAKPIERALALAARAEIAVAMGDDALAQMLRRELGEIALSAEERERYYAELHAADELERWIMG